MYGWVGKFLWKKMLCYVYVDLYIKTWQPIQTFIWSYFTLGTDVVVVMVTRHVTLLELGALRGDPGGHGQKVRHEARDVAFYYNVIAQNYGVIRNRHSVRLLGNWKQNGISSSFLLTHIACCLHITSISMSCPFYVNCHCWKRKHRSYM